MERLTPDINEIGTTEKTNTEIVFAKALQIFCLTEKYPNPLRRFENYRGRILTRPGENYVILQALR